MKLFRHHSDSFEAAIKSNTEFVQDKSRKFNDTGSDKNPAQFYFYAADEDTANLYRVTIEQAESLGKEVTSLRTYEFEGKLLDLRTKEGREKVLGLCNYLAAKDTESKQRMLDDHGEWYMKFLNTRTTSIEQVIEDDYWSGNGFWGQNCSDFEAGLVLKKELIELGYDGFIFEDGNQIEVGLIEPAQPIR